MPTDAHPQDYPPELKSAIDDFNKAYKTRTLNYVRHCGHHAEVVCETARKAKITLRRLKGTSVGRETLRRLAVVNQCTDDQLAQCTSLSQAWRQAYGRGCEPKVKQNGLPSVPPSPKSWVYANRLNCGKQFRVGETDRHPAQRANENSALQNTFEAEEYAWWERPCPELKEAERKQLEEFLHHNLVEKGYERMGTLGGRRGDMFKFNERFPEQAKQDLNQLADSWFRMRAVRASGGPLFSACGLAPQREADIQTYSRTVAEGCDTRL